MFRKYNILLILLLSITTFFQAKILVKENVRAHMKLANCALIVTKRYISPEANNLVIKEKCSTCRAVLRNFNQRLLEHFLQHLEAKMTLQLYLGQSKENPWKYYIFIVDNLKAFNELRFHISYNQFEREFYFLIILTNSPRNQHLRHQIMLEIFRSCVVLRVLHVVIMASEQKYAESIAFYTYSFSGNYYCGEDIEIITVNRFRNGTLEKDYLFPPQLTDFHGCTLNVTALLFKPWLGFNGDQENIEHTRDVNRLAGIDGDHMKLLAKILNFKVNLRFSRQRGEMKLKENSTGCFADLETGKADIAIGCLSAASENFTKLSSSIPYRYSPNLFVVRSDLQFGPLEQLALPFHPAVWLTIGITILLALVIIGAINYCGNETLRAFFLGPKNHYPKTNLFTVLLGNPVVRPPRRNFARYLLMSWLLLSLILRNAYQGKLFDSLRLSRRAAIPKGLTELIQKEYKLISTGHVEYYPRNLTIINPDVESQYFDIENGGGEKLTVVSTLERLGYYNFVYRNWSRLSYIPEQVFMLHLSLYFQRHSVLKLTFDNKIWQLVSSGITKHSTTFRFEKRDFQMMNVGSQKLPRISNEMLNGLYRLYMILIGLTIACFVLEILTYRIVKLKIFFDKVHFQGNQ